MPSSCAVYTAHPSGPCEADTLSQLDAAMATEDPEERDTKLASLEGCKELESGWVRALRANLVARECADGMVEEFYAADPAAPTAAVESALVGLALSARLSRLDTDPPPPPQPNTKAAFLDYMKHELEPWIRQRAAAIFEVSSQGARLQGYGRGLVAVSAATADLRFVQLTRAVPLPEEMRADSAVSSEYYAALDLALEPRKERGRDAALAGLDAFAELGVLQSPEIEAARKVLSESFAGHRIDALDGLRLPPLPALDTSTPTTRLAQRLPTFFAAGLFASADTSNPALLRALLERGVFPAARKRLEAGPLTFEANELYARALVGLGQLYWRSQDFRRAAEVAAIVPAAGQTVSEQAQLLGALAQALETGPADARSMMLGGPLLPKGVGNVEQLDALASGKSEIAAMAAYDAAYVLSFLPPTEKVKRFWQGIGERYDRAATLTKDVEFAKDARMRAKAARETAKAVRD